MTKDNGRTRGFIASSPQFAAISQERWDVACAAYQAEEAAMDETWRAYCRAFDASAEAAGERPAELLGWDPKFPGGLPSPQEWQDLYDRQPDEARRLYPIFMTYMDKRRAAATAMGVQDLHNAHFIQADRFHEARDKLLSTRAPNHAALAVKIDAYSLGSPDFDRPSRPSERTWTEEKGNELQRAFLALYDAAQACEPCLALRIAAFGRALTNGVIDLQAPSGIVRATSSTDAMEQGLALIYLDALTLSKKGA